MMQPARASTEVFYSNFIHGIGLDVCCKIFAILMVRFYGIVILYRCLYMWLPQLVVVVILLLLLFGKTYKSIKLTNRSSVLFQVVIDITVRVVCVWVSGGICCGKCSLFMSVRPMFVTFC